MKNPSMNIDKFRASILRLREEATAHLAKAQSTEWPEIVAHLNAAIAKIDALYAEAAA
jgi:hypothetical protein